jgi:D-alanyl-lipoteichoic acid acyltransferase DltB (MBOAT superfamily)
VLFNSHFFVLVFLPIVWIGFDYLRRSSDQSRAALSWLLLASLIFFAWWQPRDLLILVASMLANFLLAIQVHKSSGRRRDRVLVLGVGANLALLGWFKYRALAASTLNSAGLDLPVPEVVLPLAISFFTFQQIAYLVDVSRGLPPERSLLRYSVFVSFFPQLIAGPIVHWREVMPAFDRLKARDRWSDLAIGISVFSIGLAKKVLIADQLAPLSDGVFTSAEQGVIPSTPDAWFATLAFGLQLYFDFSAYSDMAIGVARMMGIDLPINFLSPYRSTSISEFWRRWHITLSRFLKDYLYIPLGGNRFGSLNTCRNLLITMALGGLWHGAQWTFLVWGLWHGFGLMTHRLWLRIRPSWLVADGKVGIATATFFGGGLTLTFVTVGWVFFKAADFATAMRMLDGMLGAEFSLRPWLSDHAGMVFSVAGALTIALIMPNTAQIFRAYQLGIWPDQIQPVDDCKWYQFRPNLLWGMFVVLLLMISILFLSRETVFLYFQF